MGTNREPKPSRAIVVAVDLTAASDSAVLSGVRMVHPPDELHIVHASQPHALGEQRRIRERAELLEHDPDLIRAYFQEVCTRADEWPHVTPHFQARIGAPAEAILQFAVDVSADLLICGTHVRHGVARLLHASVAEELVRNARCPVLVAKERNYERTRPTE